LKKTEEKKGRVLMVLEKKKESKRGDQLPPAAGKMQKGEKRGRLSASREGTRMRPTFFSSWGREKGYSRTPLVAQGRGKKDSAKEKGLDRLIAGRTRKKRLKPSHATISPSWKNGREGNPGAAFSRNSSDPQEGENRKTGKESGEHRLRQEKGKKKKVDSRERGKKERCAKRSSPGEEKKVNKTAYFSA